MVSGNDLLPVAHGKYRLNAIEGKGNFEQVVLAHHHTGCEGRRRLEGEPFPLEVSWFLPEKVVKDLEGIQEIRGEQLVAERRGKYRHLIRKHIRLIFTLLKDLVGDATEFAERHGVLFVHCFIISECPGINYPLSLARYEQNL